MRFCGIENKILVRLLNKMRNNNAPIIIHMLSVSLLLVQFFFHVIFFRLLSIKFSAKGNCLVTSHVGRELSVMRELLKKVSRRNGLSRIYYFLILQYAPITSETFCSVVKKT